MAVKFKDTININGEYTFPLEDGTAGQTLQTDGSGNISFSTIGETVKIACKNTSGSTITKGTPVYVTGTVGASFEVEIAPADASDSAKMPAVGLLETDLANNGEGYVITGGLLKNLTTDPIDGTNTTSNDTIYVKAGGGLTMTKPTGSDLIQNIGKVGRVNTANAGSIVVSSILRTNDIPNLTEGKIWVGSANNTIESTVVHIDEANTRVGIGTASPASKMHVDFTADFDGLRIQNSNRGHNYLLTTAGVTAQNFSIYDLDNSAYLMQIGYDQAKIYTNNTERMTIDSNGRVGIGTTPSQKLDVNGSTLLRDKVFITGGNYSESDLYILNTNNVNTGVGFAAKVIGVNIQDAVGSANQVYLRSNTGGLTSAGAIYLGSDNTTSQGIFGVLGASGVAGTELDHLFTVKEDGKVGIGTTSPARTLEVNSGTASDVAKIGNNSGAFTFGYSASLASIDLAASNAFRIRQGAVVPFYINTSGNVGIGTASPDTITEIAGDNPILTIRDTDTSSSTATATIRFAESGAGGTLGNYWDVGYSPVNLLNFDYMGSTKMTIDSSGNVGIGTDSPNYPLSIRSSGDGIKFEVSDNVDANCLIEVDGTDIKFGPSTSSDLVLMTSFSERMRIDSSGVTTFSGPIISEGPDGGMVMREWTAGSTFGMIGTANMAGQEYALLTDGTSTFIGSAAGGTTYIRGPVNDDDPEILLDGSQVLVRSSGADTLFAIQGNSTGQYDPILNFLASGNTIATEGAQIWYDNSVGDLHISTTYANDAADIHFYTRTGADKGTSNERLNIGGNGAVTALVDMRAPIFYDSGATSYYADFASLSNLNQVNMNGRSSMMYAVSDLNSVNGNVGVTGFKGNFQATNRPGTGNYATGIEFTYHDSSARTQLAAASSGSNNTGELWVRSEAWSTSSWSSWWKLWHQGNDGAGSGLDADLLDGWQTISGGDYWGGIPIVGTDGVMEIGRYIDFHQTDGSTNDYAIRMDATTARLVISGGYTESAESMRAPLFYDSDATTYYINPAGTSVQSFIKIYSQTPHLAIEDSNNGAGGGAQGIITFRNTQGKAIGIGYTANNTSSSDLIISTNAASTYGGYLGLDAGAILDTQADIILDPKTNTILNPTTGSVGIGETAPTYKLHVAGNSYIDATAASATLTLGRYTGQPTIKAGADDGGYLIMDSSGGLLGLNWYTGNHVILAIGGGNVGIGTTSPGSKLHINDGALQFDKTNTSSGGDFDFIKMGYNGSWNNNPGGIAAISVDDGSGIVGRYGITYYPSDGGGRFVVSDLYDNGYGASGDVFYVTGAGIAQTQASFRAPIFYDSDNTAYYADPSSRSNLSTLVVGSTAANTTNYEFDMHGDMHLHNFDINYVKQLHFNDNVRFYDNGDDSYLNFKYGDTTIGGIVVRNGSDTIKGYIYASGSGFGLLSSAAQWGLRIPDGGSGLELRSANNVEFTVNDDHTISHGSSRAPIFYDSDNTSYYTNPGGTSRMNQIDGNYLDVVANNAYAVRFWGGSHNYSIRMAQSSNSTYGGRVAGETTSDYNMYFTMSSGTNRGFVFRSSNSSSSTVAGIDASGNGRFIGDVVAYSSSDERLKDNQKNIDNALEKVESLNGIEFDWNDKQDTFTGHDVGVIAQEVEKVLPEIVNTRDTGYKAVKYEKLVPLLIEAVKELSEKVKMLENK